VNAASRRIVMRRKQAWGWNLVELDAARATAKPNEEATTRSTLFTVALKIDLTFTFQ
jgi:hypothetical protein